MLKLKTDKFDKRIVRYRIFLLAVLFLCLLGIAGIKIYEIDERIPSVIYVEDGSSVINLNVPAKAEVVDVVSMGESAIALSDTIVDLSTEAAMPIQGIASYTLKVKLFGVLPFKNMSVRVLENRELIPVGIPIGIYMETKGVLVVGLGSFEDENGSEISPARYVLTAGDYIYSVNDREITDKKEFSDLIKNGEGEEMLLGVLRGSERLQLSVTPKKDNAGNYKLGLWIRDNTQGVGTMTYIDAQGNFGALGHGINDIDTNQLMDIAGGTVYETRIVDIKKGESGEPGEMTGMIVYTDDHILGSITRNDSRGIFGTCNEYALENYLSKDAMPVGLKQEIQKGYAQILCGTGQAPDYYDVEILTVHLDHDNINRGIELKITDERLIDETGGIIQGMSGSPIIQNGKLIGAVTHVLVNDPKRGYGIFIEEMLGK